MQATSHRLQSDTRRANRFQCGRSLKDSFNRQEMKGKGILDIKIHKICKRLALTLNIISQNSKEASASQNIRYSM